MFKKILSLILIAILAISSIGCTSANNLNFQFGYYLGDGDSTHIMVKM